MHVHLTFLYISLPFYTTTTWNCLILLFREDINDRRRNFILSPNLNIVLRNSTPGGFAYIWQSKWFGKIAIKTGRMQTHFRSDIFAAVASSDRKGDVTRKDSQRRFLVQHSVAMLEQCCNHSKKCRSHNVATLCWAKNRRCEWSRVTPP